LVAKAEGVEAEDYADLMISRCASYGYADGVKLWLRTRPVIKGYRHRGADWRIDPPVADHLDGHRAGVPLVALAIS
jgi:hypothetical protein